MNSNVVASVEKMHEFGRNLGKKLMAGDIVVLHGTLGAGKTALTKGIGSALGFSDVTSPTFIISRIHEGVLPLIHVDAYRLLGRTQNFEFDDLDLNSVRENAVTVIEWGGEMAVRLQDDYLLLNIEFGELIDDRIISLVGIGKRWQGFSL